MEKGERGNKARRRNKEETASCTVDKPKKMSFQKIMKILGSGSKMLMLYLSHRVRE